MHPNDGRVVSNFILQALCNKNITVYGNGSQTRSFCYVDDMIEGILKFMNTPDEFTGPVNLGNPFEISILDLAKKIKNLTGSKSKIIFKPLPDDDPVKRKPDITLAKRMFDWSPKTDLDTGLLKTIKYFNNLLSKSNVFYKYINESSMCLWNEVI